MRGDSGDVDDRNNAKTLRQGRIAEDDATVEISFHRWLLSAGALRLHVAALIEDRWTWYLTDALRHSIQRL